MKTTDYLKAAFGEDWEGATAEGEEVAGITGDL